MSTDSTRIKELEDEGDAAADYLEELLDIAELDGDIDIDVEHGRAAVSVFSEEDGDRYLGCLVGAAGEVLDALQELTRLAVQAKLGERSRLMLDIAGHRADLKASLQNRGDEAIASMKSQGSMSFNFEPMNPFERKVLHDVAAASGIISESAGAEPHRYVIYNMPSEDDGELNE